MFSIRVSCWAVPRNVCTISVPLKNQLSSSRTAKNATSTINAWNTYTVDIGFYAKKYIKRGQKLFQTRIKNMVKQLRRCLRIIRDIRTLPLTLLPNGQTAEATAHEYLMVTNTKRNHKKKLRQHPYARPQKPPAAARPASGAGAHP